MRYLIFCLAVFYSNVSAFAQQPNLDWTTYYGGSLTIVNRVVYDSSSKCIYVLGITADSLGVATAGTHKPNIGPLALPTLLPSYISFWEFDGFIAKFDFLGNRIWATYLGGSGQDRCYGLAVDHSGNAIVGGYTYSLSNIATPGAHVPLATAAGMHAFVMKFDTMGQRLWGTYYGQTDVADQGRIRNIAVDEMNNIYISGAAGISDSYSTAGSYMPVGLGGFDAFLAKFDSNGVRIYSTYVGGYESDEIFEIAVSDYICVAGQSNSSTNIATLGTFQPTKTSTADTSAGFVQKYSLSGTLLWGTYINGVLPRSITVDEAGNSYVFGLVYEQRPITTPGTHDSTYNGASDFAIIKFDSLGQRVWGTYFGGNGNEWEFGNLVEDATLTNTYAHIKYSLSDHSLYIAGSTSSTTLAYACPYEEYAPGRKGVLAKFDTTGNLLWSSYYDDGIYDIALSEGRADSTQNEIYFVARTTMDGLGTPGSFKPSKSTTSSGLIGKFSDYVNCADTTLVHLIRAGDSLRAPAGYTRYTWHRTGGDTIAGATTRYYVLGPLDTAGYLYATMTNICGCPFGSDSMRILPTGIKDYPRSGIISIYPNPSSTLVNISWPASLAARQIRLLSTVGSEVYRRKLIAGSTDVAFDVRQFASGVYILELTTDRGSYWGKLVVE